MPRPHTRIRSLGGRHSRGGVRVLANCGSHGRRQKGHAIILRIKNDSLCNFRSVPDPLYIAALPNRPGRTNPPRRRGLGTTMGGRGAQVAAEFQNFPPLPPPRRSWPNIRCGSAAVRNSAGGSSLPLPGPRDRRWRPCSAGRLRGRSRLCCSPCRSNGQTLDDFDLLVVGEGSFAKVFLALATVVAAARRLETVRRPRAEPQAVAQLDHPHLALRARRMHPPGPGRRPRTMPYPPGGTLREVHKKFLETPAGTRDGTLLLRVWTRPLPEAPPTDSATHRLARRG